MCKADIQPAKGTPPNKYNTVGKVVDQTAPWDEKDITWETWPDELLDYLDSVQPADIRAESQRLIAELEQAQANGDKMEASRIGDALAGLQQKAQEAGMSAADVPELADATNSLGGIVAVILGGMAGGRGMRGKQPGDKPAKPPTGPTNESVEGAGDNGGGYNTKVPPLRQEYVDAVSKLKAKADSLRSSGMDEEQIARTLHAERRALGEQYKALTPPDKLAKIYARNFEKYGDQLGPTVDWLRSKGKTWEQIIESSTRTGGKDLGY